MSNASYGPPAGGHRTLISALDVQAMLLARADEVID